MSHPNSKVWNGLIDDAFALDQENPFLGQTQEEYIKSFTKGGQGSGNFGHSGRPGEIGGSAGSRDKGIQIGDRVHIKKEYGGGVGEVTDISPSGSFLILEKRKGLTTHEFSLHESDVLTKAEKRQEMSPAVNIKTPKEKRGTGFKLNPNKSQLKAIIEDRLDEIESEKALKGGQGSGNFGHAGRPGQRGGSGMRSGSIVHDRNLKYGKVVSNSGNQVRVKFEDDSEVDVHHSELTKIPSRAISQAAEAKTSAEAKVAKDKQEYEYAVSTIGREKDQGFTRDYGAAHRKLVKEGFKHTGFRDRGTGLASQTIHSYEHPDGRQETVTVDFRRRKAVKAEEGVWRTIRGSRVFIEDGKITKGPENLVGKKQGWTGDPKDNPAKSDNSDEIAHNVTVTIYDSGRGSNVDSHFRSMDSLTDKEGPGSLETMHVKTSSSALAKATRIARAIGLDEVTVHFESSRGRTKTMKVKVPETGDIPRPDFSQVDYKD